MAVDNARIANFIIGGTEKAGTTSVFLYLGEHPQVCGSANKETDFFRRALSGNVSVDRANYAKHFSHCQIAVPIIMEASPGYLGEAASVVPRIATLVPDVKLLFILREPIERLYSSYNFHVGKLNIAEDIEFSDYIKMCLAYERKESTAVELGMDEWYLKVLQFGCYANFLAPYIAAFPRAQIKVMFFENLRDDVAGFMQDLSAFLGIDAAFWKQYQFKKANVTFSGSNKLLHRLAIYFNTKTEPFLRRRPKLKRFLVESYKKVNLAREGYEPMSRQARHTLDDFYRPYNNDLCKLLGEEIPESWYARVKPADSSGKR